MGSGPGFPTLRVTDQLAPGEHEAILAGLRAYNEEQVGEVRHGHLGVLVCDGSGAVIGGLTGRTAFGWLSIELLFLPAALRKDGLGRQVMVAAEEEAARRGCGNARVDTFSFQALGFYQRQGYTIFGELEDYPAGHRRYFLRKSLIGLPDRT